MKTKWPNDDVIEWGLLLGEGELNFPGEIEPPFPTPIKLENFSSITVELIEYVQSWGVPNYLGARVAVCDWNFQLLSSLLTQYHDQGIIPLLMYGFPIDRDMKVPLEMSNINHMGATRYGEDIDKYIAAEVIKGATIGPFAAIPFNTEVGISPLSTREKQDSPDRRIIMDCSWPEGASLNDGIDKNTYLGGRCTTSISHRG